LGVRKLINLSLSLVLVGPPFDSLPAPYLNCGQR
jgi:hypothetical protein